MRCIRRVTSFSLWTLGTIVVLLALFLLPAIAFAQTNSPTAWTPELAMKVKGVGAVRVSPDGKKVAEDIVATIETMIGKIARPQSVYIVPDLPKTRSGKIMRRILAAISNTMDTGDVTTLANPDIVEVIRKQVQGSAPVVLKDAPEDIKQFGAQE